MAALLRIIARHPVVAFMAIGLGAYFLTVAIPPIVNAPRSCRSTFHYRESWEGCSGSVPAHSW
jgi:hypothetical protein